MMINEKDKGNPYVNELDNSSVKLARLATLLKAQQDELQSCNNDEGGNSDNFQYSKDQIEVIGNVVMKNLKQCSDRFIDLVHNYYISHNHEKH